MPVKRGQDSHGPYYQWGNQHKYYYPAGNKKKALEAKHAAEKQGVAIDIARGAIKVGPRRRTRGSRKGTRKASRKASRKSRSRRSRR